jgi:hypothetical protein
MFTPPRYIAIDDDLSELAPLVDALHRIGAPCVGHHFDPPGLPEPALFAGTRILFTDLHLIKGAAAPNQNFDTIAQIIASCVPADHGPYLLVLWTSHEEERDALAERLQIALEDSPEKMPLAILGLGKERFRNAGGWDGPALRDALRSQVAEIPQLAALMSWERDVLAAANATLALVGGLVSPAERTLNGYAAGLDRALSQLAAAAAGLANARSDPRGAVSSALAPLLADRIVNQGDPHGATALWKEAVTFPADGGSLSEVQKAAMHRMVHFAVPPAEPLVRTDWGAVIPFGPVQRADLQMLARFGTTEAQLRAQEFKLKGTRLGDGSLVLIRGGAACDQAQSNPGPLPMLLGLLAPASALKPGSRSAAVHECKERLLLPGQTEPSILLVSARFTATMVPSDLVDWPDPILRIREQLLMTILVHSATHTIRPGTLKF